MRNSVQQIVVAALLASSYVFIAPTATSGSSGSGGQVLHVPRDYPTIQAAVDAAAEGDTVQVKAGICNENVVVSTSGVRVHARAGVVLDGTGLTGSGTRLLPHLHQRMRVTGVTDQKQGPLRLELPVSETNTMAVQLEDAYYVVNIRNIAKAPGQRKSQRR